MEPILDGLPVQRERMLSLQEVARLTDTPIGTVRRWARLNMLPVERMGPQPKLRRLYVRASVLVEKFPHLSI